jgi:hypothetical protein
MGYRAVRDTVPLWDTVPLRILCRCGILCRMERYITDESAEEILQDVARHGAPRAHCVVLAAKQPGHTAEESAEERAAVVVVVVGGGGAGGRARG